MRKQRLLNDIQKILALNLSIAASFWGLNTQAGTVANSRW